LPGRRRGDGHKAVLLGGHAHRLSPGDERARGLVLEGIGARPGHEVLAISGRDRAASPNQDDRALVLARLEGVALAPGQRQDSHPQILELAVDEGRPARTELFPDSPTGHLSNSLSKVGRAL